MKWLMLLVLSSCAVEEPVDLTCDSAWDRPKFNAERCDPQCYRPPVYDGGECLGVYSGAMRFCQQTFVANDGQIGCCFSTPGELPGDPFSIEFWSCRE